jgi:hypothetical protein
VAGAGHGALEGARVGERQVVGSAASRNTAGGPNLPGSTATKLAPICANWLTT